MFSYDDFFDNCKVINVEDEIHWHNLRSKGIGGSDAGIIMNVSRFCTPYELYEDKCGIKKRPFVTNEAIEKGNVLEPIMFNQFKVFYQNRYEVINTKDISLQSLEHPFMRANLDGALIEKQTGRKGILEIKSTTIYDSSMFKPWIRDEMPIVYFFQCIHYLITTQFDFVILYAILDIPWKGDIGEQETRIVIINREDVLEDMDLLLNEEKIFWNRVINKIQPPFLESRNKNLM